MRPAREPPEALAECIKACGFAGQSLEAEVGPDLQALRGDDHDGPARIIWPRRPEIWLPAVDQPVALERAHPASEQHDVSA